MIKYKKVNINTKKITYNKYENDIKNKYDKNKDDFISINEYLDDEISLGPKEKEGKIDYDYQNYENIYNYFFLIKLNEMKKYKILCIPKFKITFKDNYITRTSIIIDIYNNTFIIPSNFKDLINKCKNNNNNILIYISCIIYFHNSKTLSHANMLIINIKKKTLERFEPYGCIKENKKVDKIINKIIDDIELNNYKYLKPYHLSPYLGIQHKSDSYSGMCITISMLYLQLRILNINKSQKKIIRYLLNKNEIEMKNIILRFAKYIQKKLNKYHIKVKNLNKLLYN